MLFTLFNPLVAAGIVGAVGSAGSAAIQNKLNVKHVRENRQWEYDKALEFFNIQNEYNSPQAQMNRLKEAGLNPYLIYGNNPSGAAGQSGTLPVPDTQQAQMRSPMEGISTGPIGSILATQDIRVKQAQANLMREQADQAQSTAQLNWIKRDVQKVLRAQNKGILEEWRSDHFRELRESQAYVDMTHKDSQRALNNMHSQVKRQLYDHLEKMNPLKREETIANINYLIQQGAYRGYLTKILRTLGPYGPIVKLAAGALIGASSGALISKMTRHAVKKLPKNKIMPVFSRKRIETVIKNKRW